MCNSPPPHESTPCALCEQVPSAGFRRHWKLERKAAPWHVIADDQNLVGRLRRQAYFLTILAYRFGSDGSPMHYRGPFYGEFDAEDPAQALADLRRCIELLDTAYDCPGEALHIWHSGGRGFHVTIPPRVLGAQVGHSQLPHIYAAVIQVLFPPTIAPTLDRSIYSMGKGRMLRLANRRRTDTDRHKVPLSIREVLHRPYADLEALTLRPRKGIFWPSDEELSPCTRLIQLHQETLAALERDISTHPPHHRDDSAPSGDVAVLLNRCAFIRHCRDQAATLTEPEWYAMVSNVARCTGGPAAVHQFSAAHSSYSPQETEAKITHALRDTGPHTCAFIQALGFQGCPPGGCGVKAPIALGQPLHLPHPWEGMNTLPIRPYTGYRGLRYPHPRPQGREVNDD
jgi:hypothetical protein